MPKFKALAKAKSALAKAKSKAKAAPKKLKVSKATSNKKVSKGKAAPKKVSKAKGKGTGKRRKDTTGMQSEVRSDKGQAGTGSTGKRIRGTTGEQSEVRSNKGEAGTGKQGKGTAGEQSGVRGTEGSDTGESGKGTTDEQSEVCGTEGSDKATEGVSRGHCTRKRRRVRKRRCLSNILGRMRRLQRHLVKRKAKAVDTHQFKPPSAKHWQLVPRAYSKRALPTAASASFLPGTERIRIVPESRKLPINPDLNITLDPDPLPVGRRNPYPKAGLVQHAIDIRTYGTLRVCGATHTRHTALTHRGHHEVGNCIYYSKAYKKHMEQARIPRGIVVSPRFTEWIMGFILAYRQDANLDALKSLVPQLCGEKLNQLVKKPWNAKNLPPMEEWLLPDFEEDAKHRLQQLGNVVVPDMARVALSLLVH